MTIPSDTTSIDAQTIATWLVVGLTLAIFVWRGWRRMASRKGGKPGCGSGGGCGCGKKIP